MRYVDIYVFGGFIEDSGIGYWQTLLRYGKREKYISGRIAGWNSIRCTMVAIAEGLKALKEPCNVTVYTQCDFIPKTFEVGWKRKSNLDLWMVIDDSAAVHTVQYRWYQKIKSVFRDYFRRMEEVNENGSTASGDNSGRTH